MVVVIDSRMNSRDCIQSCKFKTIITYRVMVLSTDLAIFIKHHNTPGSNLLLSTLAFVWYYSSVTTSEILSYFDVSIASVTSRC